MFVRCYGTDAETACLPARHPFHSNGIFFLFFFKEEWKNALRERGRKIRSTRNTHIFVLFVLIPCFSGAGEQTNSARCASIHLSLLGFHRSRQSVTAVFFSFFSFLSFSISLSLIYFWSVCNFSNYIRSVKPHTRIPQNRKICQFVMGHDGPMQQQQWPQAKSLTAQQNGRLLSAHRFRILLLWRFVYCILSFCCCVAPQTIFVTMLPLAIGGICRVGRKAFRLLTDLWLNSSRLQIRIHTHINWRCDCDKENTARPYIEHYNQREIVPLLCV